MAAITTVNPGRRWNAGAAPVGGLPKTELGARRFAPTFVAPTRPGAVRQEMWSATSADRLWRYERRDDGLGTLWAVTYGPTGQVREGYPSCDAGRRDTAAGLLAELRGEAFRAAFLGPAAAREQGHRWLAVHMRLAGADEADARCRCGGLLVQATQDGRYAHVDACRECWRDGRGYLPRKHPRGRRTLRHVFCGTPEPVECAHLLDGIWVCGEPARPNTGEGCGRGGTGDCCTTCCNSE